MKKLYYFTFGCGQDKSGFVQPILSSSWEQARAKMIELNGKQWAFQYTEKQWNDWKNRVINEGIPVPLEKELPTIEGE